MNTYTTIISAHDASANHGNPNWIFVDCRFVLNDPEKSSHDYDTLHISGAVYAHLNRDLSGPVEVGKTGRHPLPEQEVLVETFSRWGIESTSQVIAYDDASGYMAAARLWWLLKWAGHDAVAVLDGGFKDWQLAGYPCTSGIEQRQRRTFIPSFQPHLLADAQQVIAIAADPSYVIVDSRSKDRYRGENETIDPVAGHIPHAVNAPFPDNLNHDGTFKTASELKERFDLVLGGREAVFYCGSGVTAAHNVLACVHAGNVIPRLYAGSWSDWITDPKRPIVTGDSPV